MSLRGRIAEWANVDAEAFAMALINEYPPGAPIGWHRDTPQYDIVAGVSLLSTCRMKFRPYVSPMRKRGAPDRYSRGHARAPLRIPDDRRARNRYEHHIPAVTTLRYSITFRTLRPSASA